MDSYKVIENKLKRLEPFNGNSMSGYIFENDYLVFSYNTIIARHRMNSWTYSINPEKYSVTTSRHQNLVRRAWASNRKAD